MSFAPKVLQPKPPKSGKRRPQPEPSAPRYYAPESPSDDLMGSHGGLSGLANLDLGAKLGDPNHPLEREADAAADRVVQSPTPNSPVYLSVANQFGMNLGDFRVHRAPTIDRTLDAIGGNGATLGRDVFIHSSLMEGSRAHTRVLAHELAHVYQGHDDGIIRRSQPATKQKELPEATQIKMVAEMQHAQTEAGNPTLRFSDHTTTDLAGMSNHYLMLYVHFAKEFREFARRASEALKDSIWPNIYKAILDHWNHVVVQISGLRGNAIATLNNWSSYLTTTHNFADELAAKPEDSTKDQQDGFTKSKLIAAQHRCVFLRTWTIIQDYVEATYLGTKAPSVNVTNLLKHGYVTSDDALEFMGGCELNKTPRDFIAKLKYFPMEAAKLVIAASSPEMFARMLGLDCNLISQPSPPRPRSHDGGETLHQSAPRAVELGLR